MVRSLRMVSLVVVLAGLLFGVGATPQPVAADGIPDTLPNAPTAVFFPQTGHAVGGSFLKYWQNNGALARFGFPVSEETPLQLGDATMTVQYFERARFEYHPENAGTAYEVLLGQLGRDLVGPRADGPFKAVAQGVKDTQNDDGALFFTESKHTLANGFRLYWQANGGLPIYGYPLSQEFSEKNADDGKTYPVQYFERARFEWHPDANGGGSVYIGLVGKQDAVRLKVNTAPRPKGNTVEWTPQIFEKWIEVNLSQQRLYAHIGDATVFSTYVSTGVADHPTPTGSYHIFSKLTADDMTGGVAGGADYYFLPAVPWTMYFIGGGYAIHGTYWHHNFGHPMSHGCVNAETGAAKMLFDWAPLGTRVEVHD